MLKKTKMMIAGIAAAAMTVAAPLAAFAEEQDAAPEVVVEEQQENSTPEIKYDWTAGQTALMYLLFDGDYMQAGSKISHCGPGDTMIMINGDLVDWVSEDGSYVLNCDCCVESSGPACFAGPDDWAVYLRPLN